MRTGPWNHNIHYHDVVLRSVPPRCRRALDVGCGQGLLARGARVLELYTCRYCGTAYARAYSDDVDNPTALWSEPGRRLRMPGGDTSPLLPLDMLLEQPRQGDVAEAADYDLETGQL